MLVEKCIFHAVVVRKFSAALVVLRRTALVDSKQTDDVGLLNIIFQNCYSELAFLTKIHYRF